MKDMRRPKSSGQICAEVMLVIGNRERSETFAFGGAKDENAAKLCAAQKKMPSSPTATTLRTPPRPPFTRESLSLHSRLFLFPVQIFLLLFSQPVARAAVLPAGCVCNSAC